MLFAARRLLGTPILVRFRRTGEAGYGRGRPVKENVVGSPVSVDHGTGPGEAAVEKLFGAAQPFGSGITLESRTPPAMLSCYAVLLW